MRDASVSNPILGAPRLNSNLTGRVAVVTGASAGIGTEIARGLVRAGATVAVVGRNQERTTAVRDELRASGGRAEMFIADLGTQAAVRRLAGELAQAFPSIAILVNNAGILRWRHALTADGFEETFAVNHLAPFLLTHLLLDNLRAAAPARVVTLSSAAHWRGRIDFEDLDGKRGYNFYRAYAQSKLANILFTRALARRVAGTRITATCVHPGRVATRIWEVHPLLALGAPLLRPFLIPPAAGADTAVWLATSPEVEGQSGGYYVRRALAPTSAAASDSLATERLWQVSAQLCGVAA